jgi:propionyl-CoA carboxylase beta chain
MQKKKKVSPTHFFTSFLCYRMRDLFDYLPLHNQDTIPTLPCDDPIDRQDQALDSIIPSDPSTAYDMKEVVERVMKNINA